MLRIPQLDVKYASQRSQADQILLSNNNYVATKSAVVVEPKQPQKMTEKPVLLVGNGLVVTNGIAPIRLNGIKIIEVNGGFSDENSSDNEGAFIEVKKPRKFII